MKKSTSLILIFIIYKIIIEYYVNMMKYTLHVCPHENQYLKKYYGNYKTKHLGDSGVDIVIPYNLTIEPYSYETIYYDTQFVMTKYNYYKSYSYFLFARSSMSNYPLHYVNSVGIIDAGFRGNLTSKIYNPTNKKININIGRKLLQICANDLSEINVIVNCNIPIYGSRGSNGFGSTG